MNYYNPYLWPYPSTGSYLPQQYTPPQVQPQMLPAIQANIISADFDIVEKYSVGNGQSQMFISKDERTIWVKSGNQNGVDISTYKKEPEQPKKETEYVTKDYLKEQFELLKEELTK